MLTQPQLNHQQLESIEAPVLVVAGQNDVIRTAHTQEIADHIKQSQFLIIKAATHYSPQEQPLQFNQAVLKFLKQRQLCLRFEDDGLTI